MKQSDQTAPRSGFNTMLKEKISWINSLNGNPQNITLSNHSTSSNVEISSWPSRPGTTNDNPVS